MIRGAVFDLDGTLFDGPYDWPKIRRRLGLAESDPTILDHLASLPAGQRAPKERLLREFEEQATRCGTLRPGVTELIGWLRERELKLGLVTNNNGDCAAEIVQRYDLRFDLVQTRESGLYKPSGQAMLRAVRGLGLAPGEVVAVGDNELDNRAAHEAGVGVVIIISTDVDRFRGRCDHALQDFAELRPTLERLFAADC